ncbi:MAG: hypothetical protein KKA81_09925 [Bacteroidetes bacterium]|nr:hypothetical protein [Bacteroidota bacterium]
MKRVSTFILGFAALILLFRCSDPVKQEATMEAYPADTTDATNYFYDNAPTVSLPVTELLVNGEIKNPGQVDFSALPKHTVIVKETRLTGDGDTFTGAYRYDGYSLLDILNSRILDKKNATEFEPIIDLFVEIGNAKGEKVLVSWGEIYYPNHLHEIIIATEVMRIVPSKTNELWPLPSESKLIVSTDLITERNISSPNQITVRSIPESYNVDRNIDPFYSPGFEVVVEGQPLTTITAVPEGFSLLDYRTVFYGRGRGIHKSKGFTGFMMEDLFAGSLPATRERLCCGLFTITALDGYRVAFTYSEVMNRNDQSEVLICADQEMHNGGKFRIFPAGDFFSDRAVKAVNGIYFRQY